MDTSIVTSSMLKRFVPAPLKRAAKAAVLNRTLSRAIRDISKLSPGDVPTPAMLERLQRGWGNEGFAAQADYLTEVANRAATTTGPILECGSGLTTILLGLLAGRRGIETWSLEHTAAWRARVVHVVERFQIPKMHVLMSALRDYDGFAWYDAPLGDLPGQFQLVICDGPPGATRGGRYGLLPVLGQRLTTGSEILLDDAGRPGEADVLNRWTHEAKISISLRESALGSFGIVSFN